jgi:hypothetical protein
MTEEIGSDRHTKHSSQEIAVFAERMRNYERREKEASVRDQLVLETLSKINATLGGISTQLAVGQIRMDQIDAHIEATDTTVTELRAIIEGDKRSPVAIVLATLSALAAGAVAWLK